MAINNLLASPGFAAWLEGEPLDAQRLLFTAQGKPRISIISIAHLSDAERMFIVTLVLNEVIAWMRAQSGTSSLRAIFYMDEIFGYFPPTANPPSKAPMLTLLKQARAYGLGCVLATQNPVDLDYKGLSNAGTWLIGRLQTERDKMRVLEGLESALAGAGGYDRATLDKMMSGLTQRVFLMRNVHDDAPVLFQSRWALSYLRGPMTGPEISRLMGGRKSRTATATAELRSRCNPTRLPVHAPRSKRPTRRQARQLRRQLRRASLLTQHHHLARALAPTFRRISQSISCDPLRMGRASPIARWCWGWRSCTSSTRSSHSISGARMAISRRSPTKAPKCCGARRK